MDIQKMIDKLEERLAFNQECREEYESAGDYSESEYLEGANSSLEGVIEELKEELKKEELLKMMGRIEESIKGGGKK